IGSRRSSQALSRPTSYVLVGLGNVYEGEVPTPDQGWAIVVVCACRVVVPTLGATRCPGWAGIRCPGGDALSVGRARPRARSPIRTVRRHRRSGRRVLAVRVHGCSGRVLLTGARLRVAVRGARL